MRAPHAAFADATWHLRSLSGSTCRGVQFALPFPPIDATVFCRDSFGRNRRAQHEGMALPIRSAAA